MQCRSKLYLGFRGSGLFEAAEAALWGGDFAVTFNKFTFDCCALNFLLKTK